MTDIYLVSGICYTCDIRADMLYLLIQDDFFNKDDYLPLIMDDGFTVYIRKKRYSII